MRELPALTDRQCLIGLLCVFLLGAGIGAIAVMHFGIARTLLAIICGWTITLVAEGVFTKARDRVKSARAGREHE